MSQNTLKVHDLNEDAEFDENGVEAFDEKALSEEEPSDNDLAEEELLSQGATQRVLDATQLYLGEIGYSPLLTCAPHVSCRINWTTNRVRKKLQSNWINRLMTSAVCFVSTSALPR